MDIRILTLLLGVANKHWSKLLGGITFFSSDSHLLAGIIQESKTLDRDTAFKKEIVLRSEVREDLLVLADRHMLETIIPNLINT